MPRKKSSDTEPDRQTAPTVPKSLLKNVESEKPSAAERITVRRAPSTQATDQPSPPEPAAPVLPSDIDNEETDKAVDDIMARESDLVLAVDDAAVKRTPTPPSSGWKDKLIRLLHNKWMWIGIGVIICLLLALPYTRYRLVGLVLKKEVQVTIIDSQTDTPVSNAVIHTTGASAKTNANGVAELNAGVGERTFTILKQYYKTSTAHYFVGFRGRHVLTVKLVATGRLVPITVLNAISGQPLSGASIHILSTTAKTNSHGQATMAIPANTTTDTATVSLSGYNTKQVTVQLTSATVAANSFTLTPSGQIYFLSNQGGTINVLKSNLDGSGLHTVLAGTGHETAATTRLLTSSDWRYVVLEANRDGTRPALYLINTSNDQVTEFDSSNATFNLIGWSGHDFLYSLTNASTNLWQSGSQVVKKYDADQGQLEQLDQNQAVGTSTSYADQSFKDFFIAGGNLVYDTEWSSQGGYDLSNEDDTIRVLDINTQSKQDSESFSAGSTEAIQAARYQPQAVYFAVTMNGGSTSYFQYANQTVQAVNINIGSFIQSYPTYLLSPSGNHTVWSQPSNGQDIFFIGDENGSSSKQIATLDNYSPYGWYSDSYILVTQNNDQLYILPASGLSGGRQPLRITAYFEPNGKSSTYEYGGF